MGYSAWNADSLNFLGFLIADAGWDALRDIHDFVLFAGDLLALLTVEELVRFALNTDTVCYS